MSNTPGSTFYRGILPHWEVKKGRYFVTIRLHGALPNQILKKIALMSKVQKFDDRNQFMTIQRRIFQLMEKHLHMDVHRRELVLPEVATMIVEAITFREKKNIWHIIEYVLMPNHLHLFFQISDEDYCYKNGAPGILYEIMNDFKRWTGHEAQKILNDGNSRFWQREWFDHWSRSQSEDEKIRKYIRQNPVKSKFVRDYKNWPYASWKKTI